MTNIYDKFFSVLAVAFFATLTLNIACVKQAASEAPKTENASTTIATADPELDGVMKAIERTLDSPVGYTTLASVYIRKARTTGDMSLNAKAESAVIKALEIAPGDLAAQKLQAALHLTFHRFNEALEAGKLLEKSNPSDAFIYGVLSDANAELGNYTEAVAATQKMVDLKPNTASYARASQMRSLHGDHAGAVEMMTLAARTADPQNREEQSWCLVQLADEYWKNGNYEKAQAVYDEALQNSPDFYLALAGKGRIGAARGDLEAGVKFLTDSQNRVPNIEMIILLGDVYAKMGNIEKASSQYALAEVIEQKLGGAGDQRHLALLWADQNMRLDEALAIAEREHQKRKDIYTADIFAWCLYKKGRFAEAKTAIAEARRLKTNDARMIYHNGMIEKGLDNKKAAAALLGASLKLNPVFDLIQSGVAAFALQEIKN